MITFSDPNSTFYGVYHDIRLEQFTNIESAIKAGAFAVIEILEKIRHNGSFKNVWYDYRLYNEKSIVTTSIQYMKWKLEVKGSFASGYGNGYDHIGVLATVIDPHGKKNSIGEQGHGIYVIKSALQKLKEMAPYENYQNFSLSQKVEQLEREILKLKKQLSEQN